MTKFDLEDRLVEFAILIINLSNTIPNTFVGSHLGKQLVRSGTSVALNYGEAQSAESRKDFVHKMKLVLKELRESFVCLKILFRTNSFRSVEEIDKVMKECDELISIFVKSIETAKRNMLSATK